MKSRTIIYHTLFWASIYLLWIAIFRSYSFVLSKTITIEFCYLVFITIDFYTITGLIIPQLLDKKRVALFVFATLLVIALSAWLRALVAVQMNLYFFHGAPIDFGTLYLNSVFNISFWVLLITTGKMLVDKIKTQQQLDDLEKERIKNELDYLKAQINPHALFNSLNTIYGYIDKSNPVARNILLQFSELLRYQLYDCSAEKVSLEKEITYIRNYVAFQRLRKDENLAIHFDIGLLDEEFRIAPLLLVVLVENAFKFVSNSAENENTITISIHIKDSVLYTVIINTKEVQAVPKTGHSNGIGIANLKRRLELLYPHKYEFTINDRGDHYETHLQINLA